LEILAFIGYWDLGIGIFHMRNIKLTLQYDGTRYAGWQTQNSRQSTVRSPRKKTKTIQETLEDALWKLLREKVVCVGCGRTDAGVHALAMTAHFHTSSAINILRLKGALNGILPPDIAVSDARDMPGDFHARFDVVSKIYRYLVIQKKGKQVFRFPGAWFTSYELDVALMNREAQTLVGEYDFRSFQGSDRVARKSMARITRISVKKLPGAGIPFLKKSAQILFEIEAAGFLRSMVRNIVGTLVDIGRGKIPPGALKKILKAMDRRSAGMCAPASGLYLAEVSYE
jgi:tRNA pseudouridine38-40 synthase